MRGGYRDKKGQLPSPYFTIITVVLNGAKHLEQAIQSVLAYPDTDLEYIVIDGGSTDGCLDIIRKYDDKIAVWISEKDNGIYDAMNKGVALSRGQVVGILNSDDHYAEGALSLVKKMAVQIPADVYHGDMLLITGKQEQRMKPQPSMMKKQPSIFHPTCFVRKSVYESIGGFDTKYRISSDYDFLLRCLDNDLKFQYVPEVITCFRQGGLSSSCYSNIEGYRIMKAHHTGYQNEVILRAMKCYAKSFIKKIINLGKGA